MSELISTSARKEFRWTLLTTVSALALVGAIYAGDAKAGDDGDHPTVWIELGGQFTQLNTPEEKFAPPFILATPRPVPETIPPLSVPHPPRVSIDGDAKISFQPEGSDWVFSAAVRIGRANGKQHVHQQSYPTKPIVPVYSGVAPQYQRAVLFMDTAAQESESHAILDFQAGKDFGVGMFGSQSSSLFNFGVRFAQFSSKSSEGFKSNPYVHLTYKYEYSGRKIPIGAVYHINLASMTASRSFQGIGPSLSWNNSTPLLGHDTSGLALDWGVNAAILFGRQKARVHHQATAQYHKGKYPGGSTTATYRTTLYRHDTDTPPRSRTVIVPNVGGFAGLSYRFGDAKLNVGYRADFFFRAMDGGIDTRKSENVGFYGPFASVSIGLGDNAH